MKKFILSISLFLCLLPAFAKSKYDLGINDDGNLIIDNSKGIVEDRIHISNKTLEDIDFQITIEHKKNSEIFTLAEIIIYANDSSFIDSKYNDSLDRYKTITITTENGLITDYSVSFEHSDLYLTVFDFEPANNSEDEDEEVVEDDVPAYVPSSSYALSEVLQARKDDYNQVQVLNLSSQKQIKGKVLLMRKTKDGYVKDSTLGGFQVVGFNDTSSITTYVERNSYIALEMPEEILDTIQISYEHKDFPFFDVFQIIIEDK